MVTLPVSVVLPVVVKLPTPVVKFPSIVTVLAARIFKFLATKELFVIASPVLTTFPDEVTVRTFVGDIVSPVVRPDPLIRSGKVVVVIPLANALGSTSRLIKLFG